ncbi:MAG TPA: ABC transporter ATP-binding protein [Candidatus Binatia bacterium]|nr:ABC transporter ATP-binding protein [Candidatus Binatia bacterium]
MNVTSTGTRNDGPDQPAPIVRAPGASSVVATPPDAGRTLPTPALELRDVSFAYPDPRRSGSRREALRDISLTVREGEAVALIGANGTGKSTLLRLIGGLLRPGTGEVRVAGDPVDGPDGRVGLVFQEPRLLPWRSTIDNVAFPLELAGWPESRRRERARELLDVVGLDGVDDARPHELSGGMRQRAAIARALSSDPELLLLDEPFSALDALTRERFDLALMAEWRRPGMTVIVVSHSIPEAILIADRVVVLCGTPGTVVGEIAVPLSRPRSLEALESPGAVTVTATIRALLAQGGGPAEEGPRP